VSPFWHGDDPDERRGEAPQRAEIRVERWMLVDAKRLAEARLARGVMRPTNEPITHSPTDLEFGGVLAEIALQEDAGYSASNAYSTEADDGWDFRDPQGRTVDVKATLSRLPGVHLLLRVSKPVVCDRYVLVVVQRPSWRCSVAGWATREEVLAATVGRLRPTMPLNRIIAESDLHPWREGMVEAAQSFHEPWWGRT
jgi:hypothetical protein